MMPAHTTPPAANRTPGVAAAVPVCATARGAVRGGTGVHVRRARANGKAQ